MLLFWSSIANYLPWIEEGEWWRYTCLFLSRQSRIYVNKIENRIIFKIKPRYYLELITPKTIKLLGSTQNKITKDKNGENVPHLKIIEVILVYYSIVNTDYQQDSRFLNTFVSNNLLGLLLQLLPTNFSFSKTVWFTDQNSQQ